MITNSSRCFCGNRLFQASRNRPVSYFTRMTRGSRSRQLEPTGLQSRLLLLAKPALFAASIGGVTFFAKDLFPRETLSDHITRQMNAHVRLFDDPVKWWKGRTLTEKVLLSIVAANFSVYLAWSMSSPAIQSFLGRYFLADVYGASPSLSMLGSMFSHSNVLHISANMYVLMSLRHAFQDPGQLVQLYMTGGLVAALGSYLKAVLKPTLAAKSLGASGAIFCLLGYAMKSDPNTRFSVILIDIIYPHSFSADQVFHGLLAVDICGLIFGWRLFDHAAHLAGILYGAFEAWRRKLPKKS